MKASRALRRAQPPREKTDSRYRELWMIVEAAIFDALDRHPDYLTEHGRDKALASIAKRVVGSLLNIIKASERK